MSDSREQFEAWYGEALERSGECYLDTCVQLLWSTWQASRQALVVELPEKVSTETGYSEDDEFHNSAIDSCRRAIEAAGVRTKP